jgi:hypothetical protein
MTDKAFICQQSGGTQNDQDRLALVSLLAKAGYTVRITSVVIDGKKVKGVQYW